MRRIARIPPVDRPREKLMRKGAGALSDTELIAVLLGSGTSRRPVMQLAASVRRAIDQSRDAIRLQDLRSIEGLGSAKACLILAAREWARRRLSARGVRLSKPADVLPLVAFIASKRQEYLVCVSVNGAGEVLECRVVTVGLLNATTVHPREVFADPLKDRAAAVILAHNHPSGSARPSARDRRVTKKLSEAGELLGIEVLDHLILTSTEFFSFKANGLI